MDRQTTIGFILIGLVLMAWMYFQAPPPPQPKPKNQDTVQTDSETGASKKSAAPKKVPPVLISSESSDSDQLGEFFGHLAKGEEKTLYIKTGKYFAQLSTRGGLLKKWELNDYKTWDKYQVQLVDTDKGGDFSLLFTSYDGKLINTRNLFFEGSFKNGTTITLKDEESFSVDLVLKVSDRSKLVKRFTFVNGKYSFESVLKFENLERVISNFEYQVIWETGLRYAEHNSVDESYFADAYAYSGGELTTIDAADAGVVEKWESGSKTDWVATRNKYFAAAIIVDGDNNQGAYLHGVMEPQKDRGTKENYSLALKMPLKGLSTETAKFTVFLGPLDMDIISSYNVGLDNIMSLGLAWVIRPITEYIMLPLFSFLRMIIPNYGVVIIVFSIIIKIALYPLTKSSLKSMKKMQLLQPMMTELRERHKDDPQKMNQAVMNLYKDYGVNPAGGCLPLLLQMPILYALYMVFSSAIDLRQAPFVWWITDLSIPDTIVSLPFTLPLFGITAISGLALAMGVTMFIQQKMTVTDPRQKAMVYVMPVMMTLLFNSFPSGLNLYYFVFNLLSIGQQMVINKQQGDEPLRKVERKKGSGGIMDRIAKNLPKTK